MQMELQLLAVRQCLCPKKPPKCNGLLLAKPQALVSWPKRSKMHECGLRPDLPQRKFATRSKANILASKYLCPSGLHMQEKMLPQFKHSMHPWNLRPTRKAKSWPLQNATPILHFMCLNLSENFRVHAFRPTS